MCTGDKQSAGQLLRQGNLEGLLELAAEFHGHVCPYLSLGVKASALGLRHLGSARAGFSESVSESLLAIVECNSCFTDGVQVATGCTLGNNSLIYWDLGKTALTLTHRETWEAVRLYVDDDKMRELVFVPEEEGLFERVVVQRTGTEEEAERLGKLWQEIGYRVLNLPDSIFHIQTLTIEPIEQAPIMASKRCAACGESAMATHTVQRNDGKVYCLRCAGEPYYAVIGRGVVPVNATFSSVTEGE